jgi:hypothetical protein
MLFGAVGCHDATPATPLDATVDSRRDAPAKSPDSTPRVSDLQAFRDSLVYLDSPGPTFRAGAATVDLAPPAGVPLGGYGSVPRRQIDAASILAHLTFILGGTCIDPTPQDPAALFAPSTGVHDPVTARAVVLDNGKTKAAFVTLDTVAVSRKLHDELELAAASLGIPREHLIVSATHTHSGPAAVSEQKIWQLIAMDCFHQGTYAQVLGQVVQALKSADAALRPAMIGIGRTTEARVSQNRSGRPGIFDTELGLVKLVERDTAKPIAALVNFAVHGTCLTKANMLLSADLQGYTERELEKKLGGGVAVFLNGTEGDVEPVSLEFTGAESIGQTLAETTAGLWQQLTAKPWVPMAGVFEDVPMPPALLNGCLPLGSGQTICDLLPVPVTIPIGAWMQTKLPFAALRLDDVVFAALPGEGITEIGTDLKARGKAKGFRHTFIVGLANDYMGYVTTEPEFDRGSYESQSTLYGRETGKLVVDNLDRQLEALRPAPGGG